MRRSANLWLPLLSILVAAIMTIANLEIQKRYSRFDDFAPRWTAARWWLRTGASPYSEETYAQTKLIQGDYGLAPNGFDNGHFVEPAFYIYFFLPLSFIEFIVARAFWMTVLEFSVMVTVWLSIDLVGFKATTLEKSILSALVLIFPPVAKAILSASVLPLFMMFLIWGCQLALKRQGTGAGILLLLCLGLVPESLLVATFLMAWLASRRDNSFSRVYLIELVFLIVVTWILFPDWVAEWFGNFVRLHPDLSWVNTPLNQLAQLKPSDGKIISIILHGLLGIWLLAEWYGIGTFSDRKSVWKLAMTLNLIYFFNLLTQGVYLLLALPALFLGYKLLVEKWKIIGKISSWIGYLGLFAIYINRFFSEPDLTFMETTFPAILLPLLTLIVLQWFRWWATESPEALIESD